MKALVLILVCWSSIGISETVMELKDFLKGELSSSATMSKETFKLEPAVSKELKNIASSATDDSFTFYYGKSKDGKLQKACTAVPQQGKEGAMSVGVCFDPSGVIQKVVILTFVEDHGRKVKEESFLKQFTGKKVASHFQVGDDIDGVSGATVSSKAVSEAVRKSSFGFKKFVKGK